MKKKKVKKRKRTAKQISRSNTRSDESNAKNAETNKMTNWQWIINLHNWIDRECRLETNDSFIKEGRISGIEMMVLTVKQENGNDRTIMLPQMLELNDDPTDRVEFHRIKVLTLAVPRRSDASEEDA